MHLERIDSANATTPDIPIAAKDIHHEADRVAVASLAMLAATITIGFDNLIVQTA